jgi:hypothetical protein
MHGPYPGDGFILFWAVIFGTAALRFNIRRRHSNKIATKLRDGNPDLKFRLAITVAIMLVGTVLFHRFMCLNC